GGTVDLGTAADPGGNTINLNGTGSFVRNTTATPMSAAGTSFTVNGTPLAGSTVQGLGWGDFNDDREVDFHEKVIAGVTLTLSGVDDLGQPVNRTTQTDINGIYAFPGLRPGNAAGYTIHETQPAGYLDGQDSLGIINGIYVGSGVVNDTFSGV